MPFTTEETGLSSSIVRNLNEEVKKSKLDRVVDFCLKQIIDVAYKKYFAISFWFVTGFVCNPKSLIDAGWPPRLVAFIILLLVINHTLTFAWTVSGLYYNVPSPVQTFKLLSTKLLTNVKVALDTNVKLMLNDFTSKTAMEKLNFMYNTVNTILEKYTKEGLAFHTEFIKNYLFKQFGEEVLTQIEEKGLMVLGPIEKGILKIKGVDYKKKIEEITDSVIKLKQIHYKESPEKFMKSMIETTSVMHQRNIKLLLAPGETRLELPSPDGAAAVVVFTPKTDTQDNFFVEILKDTFPQYTDMKLLYDIMSDPEHGIRQFPQLLGNTLSDISNSSPELNSLLSKSRIESIVTTTTTEIKDFESSIKNETKQVIDRISTIVSSSNLLRTNLNKYAVFGIFTIMKSDWWNKIDIEIGAYELLMIFLFFYTILYIPFIKVPSWKKKQRKSRDVELEVLPDRIRKRSLTNKPKKISRKRSQRKYKSRK
jgi:hypothetical protein